MKTNNITVSEGDLVMLRLPNDIDYVGRQRHYNTWFRVLFIDNDGTFIGRLERRELGSLPQYKKGDTAHFHTDKVLRIYKDGDQFCYGDGVTVCQCAGLCRDK